MTLGRVRYRGRLGLATPGHRHRGQDGTDPAGKWPPASPKGRSQGRPHGQWPVLLGQVWCLGWLSRPTLVTLHRLWTLEAEGGSYRPCRQMGLALVPPRFWEEGAMACLLGLCTPHPGFSGDPGLPVGPLHPLFWLLRGPCPACRASCPHSLASLWNQTHAAATEARGACSWGMFWEGDKMRSLSEFWQDGSCVSNMYRYKLKTIYWTYTNK